MMFTVYGLRIFIVSDSTVLIDLKEPFLDGPTLCISLSNCSKCEPRLSKTL